MKNELLQINTKILVEQSSDTHGIFSLSPLEPGFGTTIGSAIRRTLFSSIEGYAITTIKFKPGVEHEFATIEGVIEDMQDIILSLKEVRLKKVSSEPEEQIVVVLKDKTQFLASDISAATTSFEVLNPDLVILNMDKKVELTLELTVTRGKGYVPAEEHKPTKQIFGTFILDTIYSPIVNVKMDVENILVAKRIDYEKLILEIETDGAVSPEEALKSTAKVLENIFSTIVDNEITQPFEQKEKMKTIEVDRIRVRELLEKPLSQLEKIGARAVNSLRAEGFEYLKDILGQREVDLIHLPNFGKQCLKKLKEFLKEEKIAWGEEEETT